MKRVIVPAALAELHDAAAFYAASANRQLGLAFLAEFEHGVNAILANPKVGAIFRGIKRRYLLRRFPYGIIYQISPDELRVIVFRISGGAEATGQGASENRGHRHRHQPPHQPIQRIVCSPRAHPTARPQNEN